MLHYDVGTENLIKKLGNDAPLHCKESYSGAEFYATNYELLQAVCDINYDFSINGMMTIEDLLSRFNVSPRDFNRLHVEDLRAGWNWCCFDGWDSAWINLFISCVEDGPEIIFVIGYYLTPCLGCKSCSGDDVGECEAYQSGDIKEEGYCPFGGLV